MGDNYSGSITKTTTKKMNHYPEIMCRKLSLCEHGTLLPYKQVRVKVVTKISGLVHMEPKNSLWTGCLVHSANRIHEAFKNEPFEILLTDLSAVEKKLSKDMVISYAKRSLIIHLAVTGSMAAGICESRKFNGGTNNSCTHVAATNQNHKLELCSSR